MMAMQALLNHGDEVLFQALTTRFGQQQLASRQVHPFIIAATSKQAGSQILTT